MPPTSNLKVGMESIQAAYDAESFRDLGHRVVDMLADHLKASLANQHSQSLPWHPPEEEVNFWEARLASGLGPESIFETLLQRSVRISDPKYLGHQICSPLPTSALAGFVSDFMNNGSGVYEMGMAGTAMERLVVGIVGNQFGFPAECDGFMTSGGTLSNLTAMLAARAAAGHQDWKQGTNRKYCVLVSEQAHYCIERAVRVMGWGEQGVVLVPTNARFQMCTERLPELYSSAIDSQLQPIAVVGSACSTSTGSFDDLEAIAQFCRERELWFHVDGAHGAALAFSDNHRCVLQGIEQANSVTVDFHKMLMTPALSSALIFRDGNDSFRAFSTEADYLFSRESGDLDQYNLAKRTFECTKTMLSAKIFTTLAVHGRELLAANVDRLQSLTHQFSELIKARSNFEIAVEPQTNIVCFRFIPPELDSQSESPDANRAVQEINRLNAAIRERLKSEGRYYIVQTILHGETWLRTTVANPFTDESIFAGLLDEIERLGRKR